MAIFRNIHITFWTDSKVLEDFTPEDKYFYLYLLTNPHTNICGCYEVSLRSMSFELGYTEDALMRLIERFRDFHKVIYYDKNTKEILLLNWSKYNWTESPKLKKAVEKDIEKIKSRRFRGIVEGLLYGIDTVSENEEYPMDTPVPTTIPDTVSDTDTISDSVSDPILYIKLNTGEDHPIYQSDIDKWQKLYPDVNVLQEIRKMSGWSDANPTKRKSKYDIASFINRWLAGEQDKAGSNKSDQQNNGVKPTKFSNFKEREYDSQELERKLLEASMRA